MGESQKTLYERPGGYDAIAAVSADLVGLSLPKIPFEPQFEAAA